MDVGDVGARLGETRPTSTSSSALAPMLDDEQPQLAADVDLAGEEERVEPEDGVEARRHLEVEADALRLPISTA